MIRYLFLLVSLFATSVQAATIDDVRSRGELRCGISTGLPGFATQDDQGRWQGFDVDMCRAVAAAVLGDAHKVKFIPLGSAERIQALAEGKIDVLSRNTTWTLSRDLDMGISFAATVYYDGQGFMVRKSSGKRSALELDGAKICVQKGSTSEVNVQGYFSINRMKYSLLSLDTPEETLKLFMAGKCDVISSDHSQLNALRSTMDKPSTLRVLPEVISQEPLSLAVREGDDRWRKVVQWTVFNMINAEYLGVDQRNVQRVMENAKKPDTLKLLGLHKNVGAGVGLQPGWSGRIIKQVGNYGEVFDRNLGQSSKLGMGRGLNALWNDGGLMYAPPVR
ncbi:amino acid ABC transporter substrate-binding protein [Thiolapillus sp.]|uniref:amino acid ABC transporter substrate-binding protein n=3 Tax=Thiolapillus sp. TaxID=2017437 RepID=UPI0025CDD95F|nr:amino acid ABC transporter substrate-binding protein [Thiolapillus sp.]